MQLFFNDLIRVLDGNWKSSASTGDSYLNSGEQIVLLTHNLWVTISIRLDFETKSVIVSRYIFSIDFFADTMSTNRYFTISTQESHELNPFPPYVLSLERCKHAIIKLPQ